MIATSGKYPVPPVQTAHVGIDQRGRSAAIGAGFHDGKTISLGVLSGRSQLVRLPGRAQAARAGMRAGRGSQLLVRALRVIGGQFFCPESRPKAGPECVDRLRRFRAGTSALARFRHKLAQGSYLKSITPSAIAGVSSVSHAAALV
jgi:hypothetical protein